MKNKITCVIVMVLILLLIGLSYKSVALKVTKGSHLTIMYTGKDCVTTYGTYDLGSKKIKTIYSRKKLDYSDFAFDEKNNILYYSDLIDRKYDIYRVELSKKSSNPLRLLGDNYNGDIFNLCNNKLFFRTLEDGHENFTIGMYSLVNKDVRIWNEEEKDLLVYNFCCNSFNNKIYSIERSVNEMNTKQLPDIPTHYIFQYNENGVKEKQVYSTKKFVNNISVNNNGDKILLDAASFEGSTVANKIYLIDLSTLNEKVIIKPNDPFEKDTFALIKNPQFSSDEKGFYFLGALSNSPIIEQLQGSIPTTLNAIYYYDFSSKKIEKILEIPNSFINGFKIEN